MPSFSFSNVKLIFRNFVQSYYFKIFNSVFKMDEVVSSGNLTLQKEIQNKLLYIDKIPYTTVSEGKAEVLFPSSHDVFYNPVQEFNRDISIAVVKQFANYPSVAKKKRIKKDKGIDTDNKKIEVLEALAASGLRSIRFAKEIPQIKRIVANDRDFQAFSSMQRNIRYNKVEHIVEACNEDASLLMYKNRQLKDRFDVVDLDPYGTASPFLDAAVQCVTDGGLLMVTCTDMAILCGNGIEACHAKYGAVSAKIGCCHEMALRIVLQCIESHANRYGRYIEPLVSLSVDFYVRVFVRIFTSPLAVKQSICKLSMVYCCSGCGSYHLQPIGAHLKTEKGQKFSPGIGPTVNPNCNICGHKHKISGPIWSSQLHDKNFIQQMIATVTEENDLYNTSKRILGILNVVLEELEDCPLYHKMEHLSSILHVPSPTLIQMRSALLNAGYRVSLSHASPTSVKTNAPQEAIWDIIRAWAKTQEGKKTYELEPSKTIMSKDPSFEVSFAIHPEAEPQSRSNNLLRFQLKPMPNWGPQSRATTSLLCNNGVEKKVKKQDKRKRRKSESATHDKKVKEENEEQISS